jgi:hypothetical protein
MKIQILGGIMKVISLSLLLASLLSTAVKAENYNYEDREISQDKTTQNGGSQKSSKKNSSNLSKHIFPSWGQRKFRVSVAPLMGYRQTKQTNDEGSIDRIETEGGIAAGVYNINIIPGNPGLSLSPYGGYTWGYRRESNEGIFDAGAEGSGYNRLWYGLEGSFTYKWLKETLGLEKGDIKYDTDFERVQSNLVWLDSGVLILPFLSGHYKYTYRTVFRDSKDELYYKESDNWVYASMFFDVMNFQLNLGPGFSSATQYSSLDFKEIATGETTYFLARAHADIFWKIGLNAQARYIFSAADFLPSPEVSQLPTQGLNDPSVITSLPTNSWDVYAFVGARNIFFGLGFGYQYTLKILDYGNALGEQRDQTQGYVITFDFQGLSR